MISEPYVLVSVVDVEDWFWVNNQVSGENGGSKAGKRSKQEEAAGSSKNGVEKCDDSKGDNKDDTKPPEPIKDYIHVRARRGQATDSHSLAERVLEKPDLVFCGFVYDVFTTMLMFCFGVCMVIIRQEEKRLVRE